MPLGLLHKIIDSNVDVVGSQEILQKRMPKEDINDIQSDWKSGMQHNNENTCTINSSGICGKTSRTISTIASNSDILFTEGEVFLIRRPVAFLFILREEDEGREGIEVC